MPDETKPQQPADAAPVEQAEPTKPCEPCEVAAEPTDDACKETEPVIQAVVETIRPFVDKEGTDYIKRNIEIDTVLHNMRSAVSRTDAAISSYAVNRHQLFEMFIDIQKYNPTFFDPSTVGNTVWNGERAHVHAGAGHRLSTYKEVLRDTARSFGIDCQARKTQNMASLSMSRHAAFKDSSELIHATPFATLVFQISPNHWGHGNAVYEIRKYVKTFVNRILDGKDTNLREALNKVACNAWLRDEVTVDAIVPGANVFLRFKIPTQLKKVDCSDDLELYRFAGDHIVDMKYFPYSLTDDEKATVDKWAEEYKKLEEERKQELEKNFPKDAPVDSVIPTENDYRFTQRHSLYSDTAKLHNGAVGGIIFKVTSDITTPAVEEPYGNIKAWLASYTEFLSCISKKLKLASGDCSAVFQETFYMPHEIAMLPSDELRRLLSVPTFKELPGAMVQFFIVMTTRNCMLNNMDAVEYSSDRYVAATFD